MPGLSPELLATLRDKLLGYRKRLLDLSLRNRLLNWKPSKRFTLNLDGFDLPSAYAAVLNDEGKEVEIVPRYDEVAYSDRGKRIPDRSGFNSDLDEEALAAKCLLSRRETDALERDSGINHCHLVLGFLEWYDDHGPANALRAPIILVPVKLSKNGVNRATGIPEYALQYDQTEVIVNPCLAEKLKDFHIEMPAFLTEEGEAPDSEGVAKFFRELEDAASNRPNWKIIHELKVSFLSFAKLRMWRDLDPDQWPEDDRLENKQLIQALFGFANANEGAEAPVTGRSIEDDRRADNIPLVMTADSSQHEAIADAIRGLNMVIQGPPGTGKSQSITNIIAALMYEGKSVLFVAEKFAALDVVKRNLESVGLGAFCMELHGTKASKPAVYAELKSRLEQNFEYPQQISTVRKEWEATRKVLNAYVAATSNRIGPREETYFEIVGRVERLRSQGINAPLDLIGNGEPCERFGERHQHLTETQQLLIQRKVPTRHAWSDLEAGDLEAGSEEHLLPTLHRVVDLLKYLLQAEAFIGSSLKAEARLGMEDIIGLTAETLGPLAISSSVFWSAKEALASKANRSVVAKCFQEFNAIQYAESEVSVQIPSQIREQLPEGITEAVKSVNALPISAKPISQVSVESFRALAEAVTGLEGLVQTLDKLGLGTVPDLAHLERCNVQLNSLRNLDGLIPGDLSPELFTNGLPPILARAKARGAELAARRQSLGNTFSMMGDLPTPHELHGVRDGLKTHGSSFLGRVFSKSYKEAKQTTFKWLSLPSAYRYPDIILQLESLEGLSQEETTYVLEPNNKKLGSLFRGVPTDWPRLEALINWTDGARLSGLTYDRVRSIIESGGLQEVVPLADALKSAWSKIDAILGCIEPSGTITKGDLFHLPFPEVQAVVMQWYAWLSAWILPLQTLKLPETMSLRDLERALANWSSIDKKKAALAAHAGLNKCLGEHAKGVNTDWTKVDNTARWVDEIEKVGIPAPWFKALLSVEDHSTWAQIIQVIAESASVWQEILGTFTTYDAHLKDPVKWLKKHITPELAQRVNALVEEAELLPTWAQYCRLRRKGEELGLGPYLDGWQSGTVATEQLSDMFRLVEYRRLVAAETKSNPALRGFMLESHEQTRAKFQKLDDELTSLSRQQIAATISSRDVPAGNDRGPKRDWTDGALIHHQTSLQRKQLPLRILTTRAHGALKALKPCMMMSPLTVAQFLDPRLPQFDVLVMDEASQIMPEDALGAIARAKQLIVVGDPKQLPPTSFFRVAAEDEGDEDDDTLLEGADSILDSCEAAFARTKRLKWHYRSLHESLIAFSNAEFYDSELLVFPSPIRDASRYGVRFNKVEGLYQNNRNEIEARAVVEAVVTQLRSAPDKSIGVITFNLKQKELIEDLLAEQGRKDPLLAELLDQAEAGLEPLIIRNLESIQGEQRDIIFISVNYGPETPGEAMAQRFGPVNTRNGWRRLNVMFSRAKERMEVFSSIYSDSIVAEPGAKTGAAYLSRFLQYAQTGNLDRTVITRRPPDSDFELSVADYIRKEGYDVEPQVGVAGFFIDLAVCTPGRTDRFILGVECDGAAYHSSRVARDRDKIRESVLRGRGWQLHRIWSTDWFQDRTAAMKRLSQALKTAQK